MSEASPQRDTRERVLEAAGELFAENGYRNTTIRDIKDRAGANIAAVNYYFRDKETLHEEVLRRAFAYGQEHVIDPTLAAADKPAEQRLRFFIHALLEAMAGTRRPAWHTQLVMRELCDPTDAFRRVTREFGRPNIGRLEAILTELLPESTSSEQRRRAMLSVFAQCSYYRTAKPIVLELLEISDYTPEMIERTGDFITEFTLAALRRLPSSAEAALEPAAL